MPDITNSIPVQHTTRSKFSLAGYTLLRVVFGLTIVTHGIPKLLGTSHGSMANPLAGSTHLIENVLHLPFAPLLAMLVALLETFGGLAIALGVLTRVFASLLAVQMIFICIALGPTYPWIDRGIEYPIILMAIAIMLASNGNGYLSLWKVFK